MKILALLLFLALLETVAASAFADGNVRGVEVRRNHDWQKCVWIEGRDGRDGYWDCQ